jgi:hypothetical protein
VKNWFRIACALALAAGSVGLAGTATAGTADVAQSAGCVAHPFHYSENLEIHYSPGCTGHDEPELDPVSKRPGSAKNLTWSVVLPSDGSQALAKLGFGFWFGGSVNDPGSLFDQAFEELQFYPDTMVSKCTSGGGFVFHNAPNTFTACSPAWQVVKEGGGYVENAAFNDMLRDGTTDQPLVMHGGDRLDVAFYVTPAKDGWHITVTDRTTRHSGTIVMNNAEHGAMMPSYSVQEIGKWLGWGLVHDTPASFVWEIGHGDLYGTPPAKYCLPGNPICNSYDADHWAATSPLRILSVHFGKVPARQWGVVSDYGGADLVRQTCKVYSAPYCTYPWFAFDGKAFTYGVDFPGTQNDFGQAAQFQTKPACGGPYGPRSTYCVTVVKKG